MLRLGFLLVLLALISSSFFREDEEKQLRNLHQAAESAMQKKAFKEAKHAYLELLSRVSVCSGKKYNVDWPTYIDLVVRFASVCEELEVPEEAIQAIETLFALQPPLELTPRLQLLSIRLKSPKCEPIDSYVQIQQLIHHFPQEFWTNKEITFFRALEFNLSASLESLLHKAKRYLTAGCYKEAIEHYQAAESLLQKGACTKTSQQSGILLQKVRFRLAECYYLSAEYEKSLELLSGAQTGENVDHEMLYLSALCFKEKQEYEKAVRLFERYSQNADPKELAHYDQAIFEIGLQAFQQHNFSKASRLFEQTSQTKGKIGLASTLYLARIELEEGRAEACEKRLASLPLAPTPSTSVAFEIAFLRGLAAYQLGNLGKARFYFEKALQQETPHSWKSQLLYHLGWCYVRLAKEASLPAKGYEELYQLAEEKFDALLLYDKESALLSLAQTYLLSAKQLNKPDLFNKIEARLQGESFSPEGQLQLLLLKAEIAESYEQAEALLKQAVEVSGAPPSLKSQAWQLRGMNTFRAALASRDQQTLLFNQAIHAFEHAFALAKPLDKKQAAHLLKLKAKAHLYVNQPKETLSTLHELLSQFEESVDEREETYYLRGLIAARMPSTHYSLAIDSLNQVIQHASSGKYVPDALYVLGTLYYEQKGYQAAQETFEKLAHDYPLSDYAPKAWYWAAEAALKQGFSPHVQWEQVYELYPKSELAPEAYFRRYEFAAYLNGNLAALKHLKELICRFNSPPHLILTHYLLAHHADSFASARTSYTALLDAYEQYCHENQPGEEIYVYYRYKALLELASLALTSSTTEDKELGEIEDLLRVLVHDFEKDGHPNTALLKKRGRYPSILEEGEFLLAKVYIKKGKVAAAQALFTHMLTHYDGAGISKGRFLPKIWVEQAKLSMGIGDYKTALFCLEIANKCGAEELSEEQALTVWILQSECYREKKEYDVAMRLLSKVINSEIASPLRIKAMYMRAELYELEGRYELAIRQLEAISKKGGEWALIAETHLRTHYGM